MLKRPWMITALLVCTLFSWVHADDTLPVPVRRDETSIGNIQNDLRSPVTRRLLYDSQASGEVDCTESLSNLRLQKLWIQDQPGGDLTTRKPSGSVPATPEQLARELAQSFPQYRNGRRDEVVILVVDDFSTPLRIAQDSKNQGQKISVPHGFLVKNQIDVMINTLGLSKIIFTDRVDLQSRSTDPAPAKGLSTLTSLALRIQQAIARLPKNAKGIVVNMSFAQISCQVLDDFRQWRLNMHQPRLTFGEYAAKVLEVSLTSTPGLQLAQVESALISPDFTRPGERNPVFTSNGGSTSRPAGVRWVAAAGNYAQHFPLYPAAWPTVIGVSASGDDYRKVATATIKLSANSPATAVAWSNWGDVTERGQVFEYDLPGAGNSSLYYYGTSFAAPLASLRVALTLMRGTYPSCAIPDLYFQFQQNGIPLRDVLSPCLH